MRPAEMTCQELGELVTAYLEGDLPPEERDRFESHRRRCPACETEVSRMRLMVSALGGLRPSAAPTPARLMELFRSPGVQRVRDVPLGLGDELVAPGDHIAYFWESEREFEATAGFLAAGAKLGEASLLVGHQAANERVLAGLERRDLDVRALQEEGRIQVASVSSTAEGLLGEVGERIKAAVHRGMPIVRVLGTLNWGRGTPGWPADREILRLEALITSAMERLPGIVVCAYDVTSLPGPMLLKGGFECHALTFRRDALRRSEHHVPTERFLEELSSG